MPASRSGGCVARVRVDKTRPAYYSNGTERGGGGNRVRNRGKLRSAEQRDRSSFFSGMDDGERGSKGLLHEYRCTSFPPTRIFKLVPPRVLSGGRGRQGRAPTDPKLARFVYTHMFTPISTIFHFWSHRTERPQNLSERDTHVARAKGGGLE